MGISFRCIRWLSFIFLSLAFQAFGVEQAQHQLVRRISVFPLKVESGLAKAAQEAWWAVREILTENKRFLVASKTYLEQKDVFQARGELSPADAITLGTLLDANALVIMYLQDRKFVMVVYDGDYGRTLWRHELTFNPAVPIQDQVTPLARKLTSDFIASMPYQGFLIVDAIRNAPTYTEKRRVFLKIQIGLNSQVNVGDEVQLVRVEAINFQPVFLDGGRVEVYAEGKVVAIDRDVAEVELNRRSRDVIKEFALVRLPKEMNRLQSQFRLQEKLKNANPAVLAPEMSPVKQRVREWKPLVAAVTFIANIATFLLLGI